MGGLVGIALTAVTGAIVCLPIALFGGLLVDARCDECGSNENVHEVLIETDRRDAKTNQRPPFSLYEPTKGYIYNEAEGRFIPIEDINSLESLEFNTLPPDVDVYHDVSFDAPDTSSQLESSGFDIDGFDGGFGSDSGDGGGEE
jgi:hypothetical protein